MIQGINFYMTFGKYKGRRLKDIIHSNPKYIQWCVENIDWFKLSKRAQEELNESLEMWYEDRTDRETDQLWWDTYGLDIGDR